MTPVLYISLLEVQVAFVEDFIQALGGENSMWASSSETACEGSTMSVSCGLKAGVLRPRTSRQTMLG